MDKYAGLMIKLIAEGLDPEQICTAMTLCQQNNAPLSSPKVGGHLYIIECYYVQLIWNWYYMYSCICTVQCLLLMYTLDVYESAALYCSADRNYTAFLHTSVAFFIKKKTLLFKR